MKAKSLLFAVIAIASTFSLGSCKKDKDAPANSFTYNSAHYETPVAVGYGEKDGTAEYSTLSFVSINPTDLKDGAKVSFGELEFALYPVVAGTYTYKPFESDGFDKTKNFTAADFGIGMTFKNNEPDDTTGTILNAEDVTGGTVTVAKNGDTYTVTYDITFKTGSVSGKYNGKITGM